MFAPMKSRSGLKLGHLGSKLGHQIKLKANIVNTLEVKFFKQSSFILLKMFSRSSSKLGHLALKTRSPGQIKGKPY